MKSMIKHFMRIIGYTVNVYFLFWMIVLFMSSPVMGQKNEIGVMFGSTFYMGDLNPDIPFAMSQIGAGGVYRRNFNEHLSLRGNLLVANVAASDARIKFDENRNLHFRSRIIEASVQGEVNFLPYKPGDLSTPSTPYFFAGAGVLSFNPQAEWEGQWYDLKPLRTEGQGSDLYPERKPYSLITSAVVFGVGFKFNITSRFTGGFEWGMRRTGTDYLDDVSTTYPTAEVFSANSLALNLYDRTLENRGENRNFQRGNTNTNDWYSFAGIILTFRIKDRSRYACPAYN
jgi:hypothetical protein